VESSSCLSNIKKERDNYYLVSPVAKGSTWSSFEHELGSPMNSILKVLQCCRVSALGCVVESNRILVDRRLGTNDKKENLQSEGKG